MEKQKDLQPETSSYLESDEFLENEEMLKLHESVSQDDENTGESIAYWESYMDHLDKAQELKIALLLFATEMHKSEDGSYSIDEMAKARSQLTNLLKNDENASPMLKMMIEYRLQKMSEYSIYIDDSGDMRYWDPSYSTELFGEEAYAFLDEQKRLSQQYTALGQMSDGQSGFLKPIASDACGWFDGGDLKAFQLNESSQAVDVVSPQAENSLLNDDEALLIEKCQHELISEAIENKFNIKMTELSLMSQLSFLKFSLNAKQESYNNLSQILGQFENQSERVQFIELFLAIEFGDDFGDRLINISKKIETDDLLKLSEIITKYRAESKYLSAWFGSIDPNLQKSINLAINERMTETIALLEKVVTDGQVEVDISPNEGRHHPDQEKDSRFETKWTSVEQVLIPIQAQLEGMEMASNILRDSKNVIMKSVKPGQSFQIYRLHSDDYGQALIYTREYGSGRFDKELEYGNYSGVEARVSMSVNPKDPYHISLKDPDALRVFGVDREGRTINQAPDDPMRSPINEQGIVSFDTGSIGGEKDSLVFKIGSVFAAGNVLRSKELGNAVSLNHNTSYFDQQTWGKANKFAEFVHSINSVLDKAIEQQDKNAVNRVIKRLEQLFKGKNPPKKAA